MAETVEFLVTCLKGAGHTLLASRPAPSRDSKKTIRAWAETIIKECEAHGLIKRTHGRTGGAYAHWQIAMEYAGYAP